jgi:hypothetical protein
MLRKMALFLLAGGFLFPTTSFAHNGFGGGTTLVLGAGQYPAAIKNYNASEVYILYWGVLFGGKELQGTILRNDTIINYKKFTEAFPNGSGFRFIYKSNKKIDSVVQVDQKGRMTCRAYNLFNGLLKIFAYDSSGKLADRFVFKYEEKFNDKPLTRGRTPYGIGYQTLETLLRNYYVYTAYDRNNYSVGAAWVVSIGIDKLPGQPPLRNCKTDAESYSAFFREEYQKANGGDTSQYCFV